MINKDMLDKSIVVTFPCSNISFEEVEVCGKIGLYDDCRMKSKNEDIVVLETRHSDDGDTYFSSLESRVFVNNSGSVLVSKSDYLDLLNSDRNDVYDKASLCIELEDNDFGFTHNRVQVQCLINPMRFVERG